MDSMTEPEFELLVQQARRRLCGGGPLEPWESELRADVDDWVSSRSPRLSREEWEAVAHADHPDDYMVIRYMTGDLYIRGWKRNALAVAELRECAREIVDGVTELKCKEDHDEDKTCDN